VQVAALRDAAWRARAAEAGVAVLYIHALNPYGFSHIRRTDARGTSISTGTSTTSPRPCR
jgi:hypothetical protein